MINRQTPATLNNVTINGMLSFRIENQKMKPLIDYLTDNASFVPAPPFSEDLGVDDSGTPVPVITILSEMIGEYFSNVRGISHSYDESVGTFSIVVVVDRKSFFSEHQNFCAHLAECYTADLFSGINLSFILKDDNER